MKVEAIQNGTLVNDECVLCEEDYKKAVSVIERCCAYVSGKYGWILKRSDFKGKILDSMYSIFKNEINGDIHNVFLMACPDGLGIVGVGDNHKPLKRYRILKNCDTVLDRQIVISVAVEIAKMWGDIKISMEEMADGYNELHVKNSELLCTFSV